MRDGIRPVNRDHARLERLAKGVEYRACELWCFVEKQDPVRCPCRGARPDEPAASPDQCRGGCRVVRRLERRAGGECASHRDARQRAHTTHLERLLGRERRQEPRQSRREHRLARAGRPEQKDVVPTRGCYQHRLDRVVVADHIGEVELVFRRDRHGAKQRLDRNRIDVRAVPNRRVTQGRDRHDAHARHECGLVCISGWHHHRREASALSGKNRGQHSVNWAQPPVEAKLAEVHDRFDRVNAHRSRGGEHGDRDTEVEAGALLRQRCGRQVDGDLAVRQLEPRIGDGSANTVFCLVERRVGKSDEHEIGKLVREVCFDLDDGAGHPEQ